MIFGGRSTDGVTGSKFYWNRKRLAGAGYHLYFSMRNRLPYEY